MFKRWYDKDPRLSLAVACLERADDNSRKKISKIIIQKAKAFNVSILEQPFLFFKRWYDEDMTLRMAMEYLRSSPPNIQKILAEVIIINISVNQSVYGIRNK